MKSMGSGVNGTSFRFAAKRERERKEEKEKRGRKEDAAR
jgi:hypothetical protein